MQGQPCEADDIAEHAEQQKGDQADPWAIDQADDNRKGDKAAIEINQCHFSQWIGRDQVKALPKRCRFESPDDRARQQDE